MKTTTETGRAGEEYTAAFLEKNGYIILERNYKVRGGEIDIIARKDDYIVFCEVKTRKSQSMTSGADALTIRKKKNIINTAIRYIWENGADDLQPRYDFAEAIYKQNQVVKFSYTENAFDASAADLSKLF